MVRETIRPLLVEAGFEIIREATLATEAISLAEMTQPDVIVLDLAMPQMNGLQAAKEISRHSPDLPMLLLTVQNVSKELTNEALHAGFKGAISKSTGSEVVKAIEVLLQRQNFFQPVRSDAFVW